LLVTSAPPGAQCFLAQRGCVHLRHQHGFDDHPYDVAGQARHPFGAQGDTSCDGCSGTRRCSQQLSPRRLWVMAGPFHVLKNLFRHRKTRYRGLAKNTAQLVTLFGLANPLVAGRRFTITEPLSLS